MSTTSLPTEPTAAAQPTRRRENIADAVLTSIIRNGVIAVTEEMKTNLMRTAYNMIIYEALDFTVGLFTPEGDTVSIGIGLPTFIRGMHETVKAQLKFFGKDGLQPGDIIVTNDAYLTGSHLNHFTFTVPVFHEGELVGLTCCMAHWIDVGGTLGGITTDIYSEGLQIPIMKYQKAGVINQDLVDIIRMNVRIPDRAMGDLRAQVTAVTTGERLYLDLIQRYGKDQVLSAIRNIMNQSEKLARARTLTIPDGTYEAESFMDDDGIDIGKRIPIKVKVIVKGDEMTVDLTEVSKQGRGFFNSGTTTGQSCAEVAYKCITSPTDYPINQGSFRSIKVLLTPGSIVSATRPTAMRQWMAFPMTIIDTIFKALEQAIPAQVIAGHHADLVTANNHGLNPRDGRFFIGSMGPLGGGWGAKLTEDGVSATVCLNDGDTHNAPIEQAEVKYPILVENMRLRDDSGGPGKYRGGLGIERTVRARSSMTFGTHIERVHCPPWGLAGGMDGAGNQVTMRLGGKEIEDMPNAKVFTQQLKAGDAYTIRSGGGGGFGSPLEREPQSVAFDVREGYVSREVAEQAYGVILTGEDQLDVEKTVARRRGKGDGAV